MFLAGNDGARSATYSHDYYTRSVKESVSKGWHETRVRSTRIGRSRVERRVGKEGVEVKRDDELRRATIEECYCSCSEYMLATTSLVGMLDVMNRKLCCCWITYLKKGTP